MAILTREHVEEIYSLVIAAGFFLVIFYISKTIPQEQLRELIDSAGVLSPLVWMLLSLITYVVAPLSGTPLLFVGFYAFGKWVILYSLLTGAVGSVINYHIARRWGKELVVKFAGRKIVRYTDHLAKNSNPITLFAIRFFLAGIHDTVSYAAGLTSIKFKQYYIITLAALIPSGFLWYSVTLFATDPIMFTLMTFALTSVLTVAYLGTRWCLKCLR